MIKLSSQLKIQQGDRLIHQIEGVPGAKHHGVFLGQDNFGVEWVSEAHKFHGIQIVTLQSYLAEYGLIERVLPFEGNQYELRVAIHRAFSEAGKPYDLITNNCEHHASYVQNGVSESKQVRNVILGIFGLFMVKMIADN